MNPATLALFLLPLAAPAQDHRWRLLPDSTVQGVTFGDLKEAATLRLAQNYMTRAAVLEVTALAGEVASLRDAIDARTMEAQQATAAADVCRVDLVNATSDTVTWKGKAQRRGRTIVVLIGLSAILTIVAIAP